MERYRLALLTPAQRELEAIAQLHLSLAGPISARKITDQIYGALEQLTLFPLAGFYSKDRALREAGYRHMVSGKYICTYRLIAQTVCIYYIVHGATDYPKLLKVLLAVPE